MRLRERLAALYPAPPTAETEARDALEQALSAKLPHPQSQPDRWKRRFLIGGLTGLAFAGACAMPADYAMGFGHRIAFSIDDEDFDPRALAEHVRAEFDGLEELRISASKSITQHDDGVANMQFDVVLDVVGTADTEAIELSLLERFDTLSVSDVDVKSIDETVHGTLGGMLSHRALGWVVDDDSAEEARARILADFAGQGLPPPRRVDVTIEEHEDQGRVEREVRVEVEADDPPP